MVWCCAVMVKLKPLNWAATYECYKVGHESVARKTAKNSVKISINIWMTRYEGQNGSGKTAKTTVKINFGRICFPIHQKLEKRVTYTTIYQLYCFLSTWNDILSIISISFSYWYTCKMKRLLVNFCQDGKRQLLKCGLDLLSMQFTFLVITIKTQV